MKSPIQLLFLFATLFPLAVLSQHIHSDEVQHVHIVIVDTSADYHRLQQSMFELNGKYGLQIDTMERTFNKEKGYITLPIDHTDEVYAGNYYPRRFPSVSLSIEQLTYYTQDAGKATMAVVAGIYAKEEDARKLAKKLRKRVEDTYVLSVDVYMGCMH